MESAPRNKNPESEPTTGEYDPRHYLEHPERYARDLAALNGYESYVMRRNGTPLEEPPGYYRKRLGFSISDGFVDGVRRG